MKALLALALAGNLVGTQAFARGPEVTETGANYAEYNVNFGDSKSMHITASSEEYSARNPASQIKISKLNDNMYVVTQEFLAYAAVEPVGAPVPFKTMIDSDTILVHKQGYYPMVTVLAPAHLKITAAMGIDRRPPNICMAYWSGFVFDEETGACKKVGASGCSNPFEFRTLEACEAAQ